MRIFLDTNVIASALSTRGLCADLFRETGKFHELLVSGQVLDELQRVLTGKFSLPADAARAAVDEIARDAIVVEPGDQLELDISDKADLPILSAAAGAKADAFVTGDKEVLSLGQIASMPILSPREFWMMLQSPEAFVAQRKLARLGGTEKGLRPIRRRRPPRR
ncbi:MAG: putative toxin-antitoxin system toxin component, PIN family [Planctomycetaceae bacterium]|nr:putative toxin-antitoxin system toxin component, PIN family [Planctomycetaceae bacterium]